LSDALGSITKFQVPINNGISEFVLTPVGSKTDVFSINLIVSKPTVFTLDGTAKFYHEPSGVYGGIQTIVVEPNINRDLYIRATDTINNISISKQSLEYINVNEDTTANGAVFGCDITEFVYLYFLRVPWTNNISGSISNLIKLTYVNLGGGNTIDGDISNLTLLTQMIISGSNSITGNIANLSSLSSLYVTGSNTLSGEITNLIDLTYLYILSPLSRISGDISAIVSDLTDCVLSKCSLNYYTPGATWANTRVTIITENGGLSSTDVDNMLIDMANSGISGKTITITGTSGAPTSASDSAVAVLQSAGCTIITN